MEKKPTLISLKVAMFCENCTVISELKTETCPACGAHGCMLSLRRVMNPTPELGSINFVLKGDKTYWSNWP